MARILMASVCLVVFAGVTLRGEERLDERLKGKIAKIDRERLTIAVRPAKTANVIAYKVINDAKPVLFKVTVNTSFVDELNREVKAGFMTRLLKAETDVTVFWVRQQDENIAKRIILGKPSANK